MDEVKSENESDGFSGWRVGSHTSIAGSLEQAAERAHLLGCNTFQIFSSSPRMWKAREFAAREIAAFGALRRRYNLSPLAVHANYLINLASPDKALRKRSVEAFRGEIRRAAAIGAEYLIFHPGSSRNDSAEAGMRRVTGSLREAVRGERLGSLSILLENTCGQGSTLGGTFGELRDMLAMLDGLPVGCCLDTAHCFQAGMDISTQEGLENMTGLLDRTVGLGRVQVIHTNDSRTLLGSRRDRHEHIGEGGIGLEGFRRIVNHPTLRDKAFILETPLEASGDAARNLEAIRSLLFRNQKTGSATSGSATLPSDSVRQRQAGSVGRKDNR